MFNFTFISISLSLKTDRLFTGSECVNGSKNKEADTIVIGPQAEYLFHENNENKVNLYKPFLKK